MESPPALDRYDYAALASALAALGLAYLLVPATPLPAHVVQYAAWLFVFAVWMLWFCYYGVKWLWGVEA